LTEKLYNYAIYDHPTDHPDNWVVRRWEIGKGNVKPDMEAHLFFSIESARNYIQEACPGATLIDSTDPDPHIAEVWM
jgi:hypothetical protein